MRRVILTVALLALGGCSGASRVCSPPPPEGSGYCQETIRDVGAMSHTTATVITDGKGNAVNSATPTAAVQPGWLAQINPFANLIPATLNSANSVAVEIKGPQK